MTTTDNQWTETSKLELGSDGIKVHATTSWFASARLYYGLPFSTGTGYDYVQIEFSVLSQASNTAINSIAS